jgi:SAM-dependent methyltransferase
MKVADARRVGDKTISDFGEQWTKFVDNPGYYGSLAVLQDVMGPLASPADFSEATVVDIGSGTGRIVRMLREAGASRIVAVEPSEAMAVLQRNTLDIAQVITYQNTSGDAFIVDEPADWVVSIGVLHHVPDPEPIVHRAFDSLKPGGRMLVWLYGREGNGLYLALALPLRVVGRRLPHLALAFLCRALDLPLSLYMRACRRLPLPLARYMREHVERLTPEVRRLTIYDQLNPAWARYYRREEAEALLTDVGFIDVKSHHRHGYSWTVMGRKPERNVVDR